MIGQRATSQGGTGLRASAAGGGYGSTTIGHAVSAAGGAAEVAISQQQGTQAMDQQIQGLIEALTAIATQLASNSPDKGFIKRTYDSLLNTWVPGIITSVVGNVLTKTVGL